jgi:hypothetical protein
VGHKAEQLMWLARRAAGIPNRRGSDRSDALAAVRSDGWSGQAQ